MKKKLIWAACFFLIYWWRLFWGGQIPFDGDTLLYYLPNWSIGNLLWSDHAHLLWDPYRNLGQPFLASPQNQALYPARWIGHLFSLSYLNYYRVYILIHVALASIFGFFLLREIYPKCKWTPLVGFLGFGFAGAFSIRVPLPVDFATIAWIPVALFFLERNAILGLIGALSSQFLAGYPPLFVVSQITLLAYILYRPFKWVRFKVFLTAFVSFMGLTCIQWLPFVEMMRSSERSLFLDPSQSMVGSTYFKELIFGFLWPSVMQFVYPVEFGLRTSFYLGPVLFVLFSIFVLKNHRTNVGLLFLVIFGFLLALGEYNPIYRWIPGVHIFRYPGNWLAFCVPFFVIASAGGIFSLKSRWQKIFLGLLALDLLIFGVSVNFPWGKPNLFFPKDKKILTYQESIQEGRIMHSMSIPARFPYWNYLKKETWLVLIHLPVPSYATTFGHREALSTHPMQPIRTSRFLDRVNMAHRPDLLQLANVSNFIQMKPDTPLTNEPDLNNFESIRFASKGQRAFVVDALFSIDIIEDKPGNIAVRAMGPGTLVVSEAYYPGWQAFIDGKAVEIKPYEDMFLSVNLTQGTQHVVFKFRPMSFRIGFIVTIVSMVLLIGFLFFKYICPERKCKDDKNSEHEYA